MDITNPAAVAKTIREKRIKMDLAQEGVAREAGVSTWTVNQIEKNGIAKVTTLAKICDVLSIPMEYGPQRKRA